MKTISFFDTKPYDRDSFLKAGAGTELEWRFHEFRLTADTVETVSDCRAVCVFVNDRVDATCISRLKQAGVRHIALRCAGFNNVDLSAAKSAEIAVTRVPAYSPNAVAEHTLALLLTLNRKIHRAYNRVREHNFSLGGLVGFDLAGKHVGIIGTGKIGRITAQIFRGFDCVVSAYDPFPAADWAAKWNVRYAPMDELIHGSDILSLHLPLTPESHHLLNQERLSRIKPGAYILNTSRGKLIETRALIDGLKSGRIGGVGLDVYEEEEGVFFEDLSGSVLQDDELSRLLTFPNVLVTAHQAFLTEEALGQIARVTVDNVRRLAAGKEALEGTRL
jgi:D-lactate dehydrogenase